MKWGDREEWERRLQEERWKGDYEGHVRETPKDYGDTKGLWTMDVSGSQL